MDSQDCFFVSRLTGHLWGVLYLYPLLWGGLFKGHSDDSR